MYKLLMVLSGLLAFLTGEAALAGEKAKTYDAMTAHDFSFKKIDGGDLRLSDYAGKTVLVVNTASKCGFTKQYDGLQKLYDAYKDRGLVVLGVPSNDFLSQEPGSNAEIKKFCETNFGITFPMTEKVHVKGAQADPFYLWASKQKTGGVPGWNFHKFLISPSGALIGSFGSSVTPEDKDLLAAIAQSLAP